MSTRPITVIGAPTNLGLKPYHDGQPRRLTEAPRVYRELGLIDSLRAHDLGDIPAPPYRDIKRPANRVRNDVEIAEYSQSLAAAIEPIRDFGIVLGGDCSVLLGSLLALSRRGRFGLAYLDAHCDFAIVESSTSGSAAGMDLALAVGRGSPPLATLQGDRPLIKAEDVVIIGHRDQYDDAPEVLESLKQWNIFESRDPEEVLQIVARPELDGFWIHIDVDVLDASVMPAVDSPERDGFSLNDLAKMLHPLVSHPRAAGLQVTIYDPGLDPDRVCGRRIVDLLTRVLTN